MVPGQQERFLLLVGRQDEMIISKEGAPVGANAFILLYFS